MKLTDNELRALHVQARAAVLKTDCTVSQVIPAFSPLASADATAMREPVPGRRDADNVSLGSMQDINNPAI